MVQNSKCTKSFNENEVSVVPQPPALRQLLRPMLYVSLGARMNACHTHRKDNLKNKKGPLEMDTLKTSNS